MYIFIRSNARQAKLLFRSGLFSTRFQSNNIYIGQKERVAQNKSYFGALI